MEKAMRLYHERTFKTMTDVIQHLQQPIEVKVELETEVVRDLDNYGSGDVFHNNMKEQPKITNNSVTIKQLICHT
jgi:hypothetical protein